jgi:hypothetical protein
MADARSGARAVAPHNRKICAQTTLAIRAADEGKYSAIRRVVRLEV